MPKIHDCLQGSDSWLALRVGRVTASELDRLVDSKFECRTGEGPKTYLYEKLAEAYRGNPLPGFSSWETDEGKAMEEEARRFMVLHLAGEHRIYNVGFVETEDGTFGCSPDALMGDIGGVEIKAPQPTNHLRYLCEERLPLAYSAQVHGCMYATGRKQWTFCSYRRHYPPFIFTVQRDEAICERIDFSVQKFAKSLAAALAKLKGIAQ